MSFSNQHRNTRLTGSGYRPWGAIAIAIARFKLAVSRS
jgi:hypothetical protein